MSLSERLAKRRRELEGQDQEAAELEVVEAPAEEAAAAAAAATAAAQAAAPPRPPAERRGEARAPDPRLIKMKADIHQQLVDPHNLSFGALSPREVEVLKLVADGFNTREIATRLAYSERTVKNVLHDVTNRLQLRNRSHAVAYAVRQGLI